MIEYLQKNPNIAISIFSLIISIFAKLMKRYSFTVKIYNSVNSNVIPFDYSLVINPSIGGVYGAQMFSTFDDESSLGINKTFLNIITEKLKYSLSKKYAFKSVTYFSSTPLHPYFFASGKFNEDTCTCERKLNRYHFYI